MKSRIYQPGYLNPTKGFTLIEMAIVLIILTLVVGGALVPLGAQIEQRRQAETRKSLDEIKEALIGYAIANKALPCPSTLSGSTPTGFAAGSCTTSTSTGYLPWATLGITRQDAWGNLFAYAVSASFTASPIALPPSGPSPTFTIQSRDGSGNKTALSNANAIPAVVISFGKNAYGALNADGISQATPSTFSNQNPDECLNVKGSTNSTISCSGSDTPYFSRTPSPPGTATSLGGEFDDMVVWISPNVLFNRMVAAGQLSN